jgi:glycerophosphoryl diester phosphodiesterase
MYIISHRGGALENKENSKEAIISSINNNSVNAIEVDIHYTKDDVAIINHDDNLNRCFGINENIFEVNFNQIKSVVLSLDKLLNIVDGQKTLFLEIKGNLSTVQIVKLSERLFEYIQKNVGLLEYFNNDKLPIFMIITFNYDLLNKLHKYFDKSMLGFITSNKFDKINTFYILDNTVFSNLIIDSAAINTDYLNELNKYNLNIFVYGVNYPISLNKFSEENLKIIKGFITDSPTSLSNKLSI